MHEHGEAGRVALGDDHAVLRAGVAALLETEGFSVVGQAGTVAGVLALAERRAPDVLVVDLRLPDGTGFDVLRRFADDGVPTPVILYTGFEDVDHLEEALVLGARGYVLKSGPPGALVQAVEAVRDGRRYIDAALAPLLLTRREEVRRLSPREREVLDLLAGGRTTDAVAAHLFLSPATVRSYVESAMEKLEAANRVQAVAEALRQGLIA